MFPLLINSKNESVVSFHKPIANQINAINEIKENIKLSLG